MFFDTNLKQDAGSYMDTRSEPRKCEEAGETGLGEFNEENELMGATDECIEGESEESGEEEDNLSQQFHRRECPKYELIAPVG